MAPEQFATARSLFPVTELSIYLNHASTGPMPRSAVAAIAGFAQRAAELGQVPYPEAEAMVERARALLASLLHVAPETIGFTKNTSSGVIIAIGSFEWRPGDNVVLMADDFPTVTYPFRLMLPAVEQRFVRSADLVRDVGAALSRIDGRTRMVAVSWVHFLTGRRFDIATLCRECRRRGVTTVIDAIQGIGAVECDWAAVDADFIVSHGAKWLLAPQGTGYIRVRPETLGGLRPFNLGWLSCRWEAFNDIFSEKPLKPGAARFEEGTKNYLGIAGLGASLDLFQEFGPAAIAARIRSLAGRVRAGFERLGFDVVTPPEPERSAGMVTATKAGADMAAAFARLEREGIAVSLRENMLRVAPHFYNTEDEVDRFLAVLAVEENR